MRTLSATLTSAQKGRSISPIARIVLTYAANSYTYDFRRVATDDTLLIKSTHSEKQWSQTATVTLIVKTNTDALNTLNLEGYKGVISYGFTTSAGDEWSATAPLWVVGQQRDSMQGKLLCILSLEGIFDRMAKDKANASLSLEDTDTRTVKTLITAIAGATLAPYSHCKAFTVTYDSEDSLIDTFIPADFFRINLNDSRLSKIRELLSYTTCKIRPEADGNLHVLDPTTTGSTYDYEYRLEDTYHTFLSKRFRRRVVSPNYVVVQSHPEQGFFTGFAKDDSADLTDMEEREYHNLRPISNAQATSLATAILSHYQLQDEKGAGILPIMNIGAEIYDYVSVNDTRANDNAVGNIGWITRNVARNSFGMEFGFGRTSLIPLQVMAALATGEATQAWVTYEVLKQIVASIYANFDKIIDILEQIKVPEDAVTTQMLRDTLLAFIEDGYFRKLTVGEQLTIPYSAS